MRNRNRNAPCLALALLLLASAFPAQAARHPVRKADDLPYPVDPGCPKNRKEWQAKGPALLAEKATHQHGPVEIPDLSASLKKKKGGASGHAQPFRGIDGVMVMVEVKDDESALYLSGVLKCDTQKHAPVLVSLTYVKGNQSGLVKITEE